MLWTTTPLLMADSSYATKYLMNLMPEHLCWLKYSFIKNNLSFCRVLPWGHRPPDATCCSSYSSGKCTRYSSMQRYVGKWTLCDVSDSLRKQPTSREVTTWTLTKWRLSNKCRNSILMTCHYPDLGSASDWLKGNSHAFQQIRSTT